VNWFESIAEARRRARRHLPKPVWLAVEAGAEAGVTRADNERAFSEIRFAPPRLAGLPAERDLSTTVLGLPVSLPVIASPVGVQAVHPLGEVAVAIGTRDAGTAMGLSEFASRTAADAARVNPDLFFQVHWSADRDTLLARAQRARAAGARALAVTLDWSFPAGRDWGSPFIPERINAAAVRSYALPVLTRPRYLWDWLRQGGLPDLTVPNIAAGQGFFAAYRDWQSVPPPSWEDVAWLREQWGGPFLVKGVMRPDDARRAIDLGADAVSVSNHGGNNLDGTPATMRALPGVVQAAADASGGRAEVLLDGGIRRGGDVAKALALGARAVMIGRPVLWGLAADGPDGVRNVFDILRAGLDSALLSLGRASVSAVTPDDVILPPGFSDGLG
jgi:heme/flavin dehydrogenase (mycofactocin system)